MRIALLQAEGRPTLRDTNLTAAADAMQRAAAGGAGLLLLPELFTSGYAIGDAMVDLAEPRDGESATRLDEAASRLGIAVLYGYPERADGAIYNSARLIDAAGRPRLDYRKTHLWGPEENRLFRPGDALVQPVRLGGVSIGVLICYDVEFPEPVRALALAGADLIAVPTATSMAVAPVSSILVPARAYENQVFVAYANRCGREGDLAYVGGSTVAAPNGAVLARAGETDEIMLFAEIDPAAFAASRADTPYLADRRPEIYAGLMARA